VEMIWFGMASHVLYILSLYPHNDTSHVSPISQHQNNHRYGRVICCIGVNPNKRYDVTPQARAQILREMLSGGDDGSTRCKNVQVEGNDMIFYP